MYGSGPETADTSDHVNLVTKINADGSFMITGGNEGNSTVSVRGRAR